MNFQEKHPFRIDLDIHHPSFDPAEITQSLSLEPWFARKRGECIGPVVQGSNVWFCHFQKGEGNSEFEQALESVVSLLSEHEDFLSQLTETEGEIEVILNSTVELDEGKIFELRLHPWFLNQLSIRNVSLRIQAWSGQAESRQGVSGGGFAASAAE